MADGHPLQGMSPNNGAIQQGGSQFGETHVSGGVSLQGNFVGVTINSPASARNDYIGQYAYTSLRPIKTYVQRPDLRDRIRNQLCGPSDDARRLLVVWGLGGSGKTQLVLDYIRQYRNDYSVIFWIEAGQRASVERDFINIYKLLFATNVTSTQETIKIDDAVLAVKNWFLTRRERTLVVFDGADTIDDENDTEYMDLDFFLPDCATVDTIVTTRTGVAKDMSSLEGVKVEELSEEQAIELFYKSSGLSSQTHTEEATCIVRELGFLALAIHLAGTYISRTPRLRSNIAFYLPEYNQRRKEILSRSPEKLVHRYSYSVLTVWETSHKAIRNRCQDAAMLLTMLSFLNCNDIYLELFTVASASDEQESRDYMGITFLENWRSFVFSTDSPQIHDLESYFEILNMYSMVQWDDYQQSYSMHKLVHAWGSDRLDPEGQRIASTFALQIVCNAISQCGADSQERMRLAPHVMASFNTVAKTADHKKMASGVLAQLVYLRTFLSDLGLFSAAFLMGSFIKDRFAEYHGEEHPFTLLAIGDLGATLRHQGKFNEAVELKTQVLEKSRRIFGKESVLTALATLSILTTLEDQGQGDGQVEMIREAIKKLRLSLGDEDEHTLIAMNNLAAALARQKKFDEATELVKDILEKRKRILGETHRSTLGSNLNLALMLSDQGKLEEAMEMQRDILKKSNRVFGEDHFFTLCVMGNLGISLSRQGKASEALAIKKLVLERSIRSLGEDHPSTIWDMDDLASTLEQNGELEEAIAMRAKSLEKRKKVLGNHHPLTIKTMTALARMFGNQSKFCEAAVLEKEILDQMRKMHGDDHPLTLSILNNLAKWTEKEGKFLEAESLKQDVVEKSRRIHGEDDFLTICAIDELAGIYFKQKNLERALECMREVMQKSTRVYGEDDRKTVFCMDKIANIYGRQGKIEDALVMRKEVLTRQQRIHGDEHPDTQKTAAMIFMESVILMHMGMDNSDGTAS